MTELFKKAALAGDVWVLWVLIAASVASLSVMIERWRAFREGADGFDSFQDELARRLNASDLHGARRAAEGAAGMEARVALAGLENASKGAAAAQEAMTGRLIRERSALEKNLIVLGTLGNNAPFVGLFGTVLGIIKAFNDLAVTGASGSAVVMAGISSALVATAFGILVAIPAVAANNYFQTRLKRRLSAAQGVVHLVLVFLKDSSRKDAPRPAREAVQA